MTICDCGEPAERGDSCQRCDSLDGASRVESLVIAELALVEDETLNSLAELTGASRRQVLRVLHTLEARGRVAVCREQDFEPSETSGWGGRGGMTSRPTGFRYRLADPGRRRARQAETKAIRALPAGVP